MKYIIFKGNGLLHPIVFGEHTSHSQISVAGAEPISAGFVHFNSLGDPYCTGKSDSLKLESNPERDTDIIRHMMEEFGTMFFIADIYD